MRKSKKLLQNLQEGPVSGHPVEIEVGDLLCSLIDAGIRTFNIFRIRR
jgi:hypothetical protein